MHRCNIKVECVQASELEVLTIMQQATTSMHLRETKRKQCDRNKDKKGYIRMSTIVTVLNQNTYIKFRVHDKAVKSGRFESGILFVT